MTLPDCGLNSSINPNREKNWNSTLVKIKKKNQAHK